MTDASKSRTERTKTSPVEAMAATHTHPPRTRPRAVSNDATAWPEVDSNDNDHDTRQPSQNIVVPQWQRELAASRVGRHSRASSVFSTRTRVTVESDDARSVEIQAGGQSFRIGRDGVTNVTAPPPYSARSLHQLTEESDEEASTGSHPELEDETIEVAARKSSDSIENRSPVNATLPLRLHMPPGALVEGGPAEDLQATSTSQVLDFPRKLMNMFSSSKPGTALPIPPREGNTNSMLRRTQSDSSDVLSLHYDAQLSAQPQRSRKTHQTHHSLPELPVRLGDFRAGDKFEPAFEDDDEDEVAAEMSKYYNRVMRDLDHDYRRKLHQRDVDLARSRELLNEKDIVYRQQLRDRDNTIDTLTEQIKYQNETINQLKTRLFELEEDVDRRIEQAEHQTEDKWEKRWKEYEKLLRSERKTRASIAHISTSSHQQSHVNDDDDDDNDHGDNDSDKPESTAPSGLNS